MWEFLPPGFTGDLLFAAGEDGARRLPPYLGEWWHLARRRVDWGRYDVVFAWEMRAALAAAVGMRGMGRRRPRFVVVGPILKGPLRRPAVLRVVRALLGGADRWVCFSRAECDEYAALLGLPRERFVFLPTPWRSDETISEADGGYILALGRSARDYPTLLEAVRGTELPVVIVAGGPGDLEGASVPPNATVRYNTDHDETNRLIAEATLHAIPLHDVSHSAGQTVLLRAMARGKAVVITDTPGTRDYTRDNETAVRVPPGDAAALRAALTRLWADAEERRRLGHAAARAVREEFGFERFAGELAKIADSNPLMRERQPK